MKFEAYKKFQQTPYSISLLNIERKRFGKSRRVVESSPIEGKFFKTIEDAKEFAHKEGLKEDEYEIITWGI